MSIMKKRNLTMFLMAFAMILSFTVPMYANIRGMDDLRSMGIAEVPDHLRLKNQMSLEEALARIYVPNRNERFVLDGYALEEFLLENNVYTTEGKKLVELLFIPLNPEVISGQNLQIDVFSSSTHDIRSIRLRAGGPFHYVGSWRSETIHNAGSTPIFFSETITVEGTSGFSASIGVRASTIEASLGFVMNRRSVVTQEVSFNVPPWTRTTLNTFMEARVYDYDIFLRGTNINVGSGSAHTPNGMWRARYESRI